MNLIINSLVRRKILNILILFGIIKNNFNIKIINKRMTDDVKRDYDAIPLNIGLEDGDLEIARLMLAVLRQTRCDLTAKYPRSINKKKVSVWKKNRRDALRWVIQGRVGAGATIKCDTGEDFTFRFSFLEICCILQIDPQSYIDWLIPYLFNNERDMLKIAGYNIKGEYNV